MLVTLLLSLAARATAADEVHAFVGARILPISGPPIERGVLVVRGARIEAVGAADKVSVPSGALVHDVSGKWLMPGLVDTHSHIGEASGADESAPIQPDARILDSFDVRAPSLQRAQAGGITTCNVMPGSGHLLGGQTLYFKLKDANSVEDLAIRWPDGAIAGGMKMANGTNSRGEPPFPGTRAKSAALVREKFIAAQEYERKLNEAGADASKRPARDLGMEALLEVLRGKRIVHHHTHRHDDVLTVLRLQKEFGFKVVLHHVTDAWKVASEIAAAGAPCSLILVDCPGGKLEARDLNWGSPAAVVAAGGRVSIHTDDWINDSRLFLRCAGMAVRGGLSREKALEALTLEGARQLELEARVGSLESGKDADFVVLDGDPLSVYTHVEQTWIEGAKVFDRGDPRDKLWAVGGYGAGNARVLHDCCGERHAEDER
ncbi:MAG: amidohydrolase [Planctomycetota bacterium]|nr:MAG: amidohydrolase [Planctomycetota bacterium]